MGGRRRCHHRLSGPRRAARSLQCQLALSAHIAAVEHDGFGGFVVRLETDAGHSQPGGAAQDRRMWIELIAYAADGSVLYASGDIADDELGAAQSCARRSSEIASSTATGSPYTCSGKRPAPQRTRTAIAVAIKQQLSAAATVGALARSARSTHAKGSAVGAFAWEAGASTRVFRARNPTAESRLPEWRGVGTPTRRTARARAQRIGERSVRAHPLASA